MLTKLDRYIIWKFLSTFFFAVTLIIAIAIVIDLSEKIDDFIENNATAKQLVFEYYLYFIPSFYNLFNNLFVFIAVIFFTSKMAANSEIVAILASGISFWRFMRPYLISAVFLGLISFYLNSWVIPYCDSKRVAFENTYINGRKNANFYHTRIHRQLKPGLYMYMDLFDQRNNVGYRMTLERFENRKLVYKLGADKLRWSADSNTWVAENYMERIFDPEEYVIRGTQKPIELNFDPEEFFMRREDVGVYNNEELDRVIEAETMRGAEKIEYYLLEKYRRRAMPFSTLVLTLIGVSISSRKVRGGIGLHIGFGLGLAFSFIFLTEMTFTFAHAGGMAPWLAVWLPIVLYLIVGWILYRVAPK